MPYKFAIELVSQSFGANIATVYVPQRGKISAHEYRMYFVYTILCVCVCVRVVSIRDQAAQRWRSAERNSVLLGQSASEARAPRSCPSAHSIHIAYVHILYTHAHTYIYALVVYLFCLRWLRRKERARSRAPIVIERACMCTSAAFARLSQWDVRSFASLVRVVYSRVWRGIAVNF